MNKLFLRIKMHLSTLEVAKRVRRWISPVFVMMLAASFVLWYIAKLSYTYTTELDVRVKIEEQDIDVRCVVEGVGTNLFGYKIGGREDIKIPVSELRYNIHEGDNAVKINLNSLSGALSVRFSDIKIISIYADTELEYTPRLQEAINRANRRR